MDSIKNESANVKIEKKIMQRMHFQSSHPGYSVFQYTKFRYKATMVVKIPLLNEIS